ncbi:prolipoprotein diacylglyceryl transferase [Candidatus Woesearchaeota archaeon ex4484_78]|nr:MAG: prolipoprotein diacylglyceryl transferase [Candidatus Woesearchaeota archaeon ex4484_78]
MIRHALNPVILNLGPLEIRWYGLMYVLGFFVVYFYVRSMIKKKRLKLSVEELDNLLVLLIFAMILGARLFYAIFYNPSYFVRFPLKFFAVWEGGLSFHGALLAIILTGFFYCKKKNISFLETADVFIVPVALANAFGRIGNFINAELYGKVTGLPWGVLFPGVSGPRHPTQIYEAFYNVVIFSVLFFLRNKVKKKGVLLGLFLFLYAFFRFFVEFLKDLPVYGPLTMGQWLCLPMFVFGLWLVFRKK